MSKIRFTQITSASCELAKRYGRDAEGKLTKTAIAHMTEGQARIVEIEDVTQLCAFLPLLKSEQAITCGVPNVGDTKLTTRAGADFRADAVARTNEAFSWPSGPALFAFDVDIDKDHPKFTSVGSVLDALESCHPWLRDATRVAVPSSSSFVGGGGLQGVHAYCVVSSGTDIPELAKRTQIEQWAAGHGTVKISKSGALLVRQLSDALIYQPSRLMFEAQPVCDEGVERSVPPDQTFVARAKQLQPQGRPSPARTPEGWLNVRGLPPIKAIEERRFETAMRQAKNARRREAKRVAIDYQKTNAIASGYDAEQGERFGIMATRALGDGALPASWQLVIKGGDRVTVADILANLGGYLGTQCADPFDTWRPDLEPKHFGKAEIVKMGDDAGVWSHKLQEFFKFTDDRTADLASPLDLAAEKLCGLIEYPEKMGRAAPFVNVKHGLRLLLTEIDAIPRQNVCAPDADDADGATPLTGALCDALSRIGCSGVTPAVVEKAIASLAQENRFDPWRDAVLALPQWDGTPRLDTVCADIFGDETDSEAHRLTGRLIFAGPIARQLWPGITCDVVPVLYGAAGGERKSTFVRELAEALGAPQPSSVAFSEDRRMSMAAARSVVAELAEMAGAGRRESEDIKRWIADAVDVYRAPYDRKEVAHPRRFFLIGTANKDELLRDAALARRFMTINVRCTIAGWQSEARQLFAEAKARFCQSREAFDALASAATIAVQAFNVIRMQCGEGIASTVVDDVLPDVTRALAATRGGRFRLADVMAALAARLETKGTREREVTEWLARTGCKRVKSNGRMLYELATHLVGEDSNDAASPTLSPFVKDVALALH